MSNKYINQTYPIIKEKGITYALNSIGVGAYIPIDENAEPFVYNFIDYNNLTSDNNSIGNYGLAGKSILPEQMEDYKILRKTSKSILSDFKTEYDSFEDYIYQGFGRYCTLGQNIVYNVLCNLSESVKQNCSNEVIEKELRPYCLGVYYSKIVKNKYFCITPNGFIEIPMSEEYYNRLLEKEKFYQENEINFNFFSHE